MEGGLMKSLVFNTLYILVSNLNYNFLKFEFYWSYDLKRQT